MSRKGSSVIEISSSSSDEEEQEEEEEKKGEVKTVEEKRREEDDDEEEENEEEEEKGAVGDVSPISDVEVKTAEEKRREEEDCCILDFDPFEPVSIDLKHKLSLSDSNQMKDEDLSIVAERGQVACRDYPHSRHLCAEYPFSKTPHESYCPQCYCYVCDATAPCMYWKRELHAHCHASDKDEKWKNLRSTCRAVKSELNPKPSYEEEDDKGKIVKISKAQFKEEDDDCYEIDPIDFTRKLTFLLTDDDADDELALVAEKGPVALRDFPHPRHLCGNFPFNTTSHESYCSKCFCYVCEIAAPCLQWQGASGHCNISKKT